LRSAINENLVRATPELSINDGAIHENEGSIFGGFDMCVITRSAGIIKDDRVVRRPPNRAGALGWKTILPLTAAGVSDFEKCHNELSGL
jgi:hypothetical protein